MNSRLDHTCKRSGFHTLRHASCFPTIPAAHCAFPAVRCVGHAAWGTRARTQDRKDTASDIAWTLPAGSSHGSHGRWLVNGQASLVLLVMQKEQDGWIGPPSSSWNRVLIVASVLGHRCSHDDLAPRHAAHAWLPASLDVLVILTCRPRQHGRCAVLEL